MSDQAGDPWMEGLQRLTDEAGGVLQINLIRAEEGAGLEAAARDGDPDAGLMFRAVLSMMRAVNDPGEARHCLCCNDRLRLVTGRSAFGVIRAASGTPRLGIAFMLCNPCSALDRAHLLPLFVAALRGVWPDARHISIGAAGHA